MAKTFNGKTWRQHVAPYLKRALAQASKAWKPKGKAKSNVKKLAAIRKRRDIANKQIRDLIDSL